MYDKITNLKTFWIDNLSIVINQNWERFDSFWIRYQHGISNHKFSKIDTLNKILFFEKKIPVYLYK